jgi:hypothetical protein
MFITSVCIHPGQWCSNMANTTIQCINCMSHLHVQIQCIWTILNNSCTKTQLYILRTIFYVCIPWYNTQTYIANAYECFKSIRSRVQVTRNVHLYVPASISQILVKTYIFQTMFNCKNNCLIAYLCVVQLYNYFVKIKHFNTHSCNYTINFTTEHCFSFWKICYVYMRTFTMEIYYLRKNLHTPLDNLDTILTKPTY